MFVLIEILENLANVDIKLKIKMKENNFLRASVLNPGWFTVSGSNVLFEFCE